MQFNRLRVGWHYWHKTLGKCEFDSECHRRMTADPFEDRVYMTFNSPDGPAVRLVRMDLVSE